MKGNIHFIGIGGTGLSAIARLLLERGEYVSGSDHRPSPMTNALEEAGARITIGHRPGNVNGARLVVRSSAIPDNNIEVETAHSAGVPVLKRAEFLETLTAGYRTLAIAGTHGKTTTSGMLATVLSVMGHDPSFIVGSTVSALGVNAHAGHGPDFVIEADEYDGMFLGLSPEIAVVTNVEHDHPDCYPNEVTFKQAFRAFVRRLQAGGTLIACQDDPGAIDLAVWAREQSIEVTTYGVAGFQQGAVPDYSASHLGTNQSGGYDFEVWATGSQHARVSLMVPGKHNVLNALACLAVIDRLGYSLPAAAQTLARFTGTGRRFEIHAGIRGVTIVNDYAHHPTEIEATLHAARDRFPQSRIIAVWQPHTYSRTRLLFDRFAAAFEAADLVIVSEIFPAREAPPADGFSARSLVEAMEHPDVRFVHELVEIVQVLKEELKPADVLLVLSAGDADWIAAQFMQPHGSVENG